MGYFGGGPETHFLVTFELLLILRGFGGLGGQDFLESTLAFLILELRNPPVMSCGVAMRPSEKGIFLQESACCLRKRHFSAGRVLVQENALLCRRTHFWAACFGRLRIMNGSEFFCQIFGDVDSTLRCPCFLREKRSTADVHKRPLKAKSTFGPGVIISAVVPPDVSP